MESYDYICSYVDCTERTRDLNPLAHIKIMHFIYKGIKQFAGNVFPERSI